MRWHFCRTKGSGKEHGRHAIANEALGYRAKGKARQTRTSMAAHGYQVYLAASFVVQQGGCYITLKLLDLDPEALFAKLCSHLLQIAGGSGKLRVQHGLIDVRHIWRHRQPWNQIDHS